MSVPTLEIRSRPHAGALLFPGDAGWDEARRAWNLSVDQHPSAVALPESAEDVAAVVRYAAEHGLRVAPQGTGHGAGALGPLDDTILVRTTRMRRVEIDAESRTAFVQAGAEWQDVTVPAAAHGLAALAGSSPDVGVAGYTLGGGMGWLARKHGLAANSVVALEVVTADGAIRRIDGESDPDLFWAVRGGGGSFGVVTALELRLYPVRDVYAGALFWPMERAREVLNAWSAWAATVPDEVTSCGRLLQFPPIPEVPEAFRGRSFVVVEAALLADEEEAARLLAPLRALRPDLDTFATVPAPELQKLHMDPEGPSPGLGDGMLLSTLDADAVEALLAVAGPEARSPFVSVEIRHLGGALAEARPGAGALAAIDAGFVTFALGVPLTPELAAQIETRLERLSEALAPWDAGKRYFNFSESTGDPGRHWSDEAYARLLAVKARVDPGGRIRANHPIDPA